MGSQRLRLTPRGVGLAVVGTAAAVGGTLLGVTVLLQLGLLLLLTVAGSVLLLLVGVRRTTRGGLVVERDVRPHPVTAGDAAEVTVTVRGRTGNPVDRLQIAERAARELSGGLPLRARVRRDRTRISLTYPLSPDTRGRWAVGPLQVRRRDVFGCAGWAGPLGEPYLVAVRPATVPLRAASGALSSDSDRAAGGARTPAPDDALLRDYRSGDDLRRVHWPSSARRGELLVRQDDTSGRRPASVLLDLAEDGPTTEWSIRLAASIALALVGSRHHVRLLGGDVLGAGTDHHRPDVGGVAAAALLDQTVDLHAPDGPEQRHGWFGTAVDTLRAEAGGSELVLAVVGALPTETLVALARTSETTHGWALVRTGEHEGAPADDAARATADQLRRAGWTVCLVTPGEDVATAWTRLLAADDRLLSAR